MKKYILIGFWTLGALTSTKLKAENGERKGCQSVQRIETQNLESTVYFDGSSNLRLGLVQPEKETIKLQFVSGTTCLFSATYREQAVSEVFDLSQFPEGSFKVRLIKGSEIIEKEFFKSSPASTFE